MNVHGQQQVASQEMHLYWLHRDANPNVKDVGYRSTEKLDLDCIAKFICKVTVAEYTTKKDAKTVILCEEASHDLPVHVTHDTEAVFTAAGCGCLRGIVLRQVASQFGLR